jgi:hypothetical protein
VVNVGGGGSGSGLAAVMFDGARAAIRSNDVSEAGHLTPIFKIESRIDVVQDPYTANPIEPI